jgi:hypothetical protein
MDVGRTTAFARNEALERLLAELNGALGTADDLLADGLDRPTHPVVLVVGGPRSGSTVTMQFLAATGRFAYPTNLLSRFYGAPAIGARIQALLCDPRFDFRGELADVGRPIRFDSELGKSSGALQPNEFWYFWRRFFPIDEPRFLTDDELRHVDRDGFLRGLASIEAVDGRPLALKGMLLQQHIPYLADLLDRVVFVDVKRHPFFQCQSILEARRKFFGSIDRWYSVKPREWEWLRDLDPYHQVAGQVLYNRRRVDEGLAAVGADRTVVLGYDEFCADPARLYTELVARLDGLGHTIDTPYEGPAAFESRDAVRLDDRESDALLAAWHDLGGEPLPPIGG